MLKYSFQVWTKTLSDIQFVTLRTAVIWWMRTHPILKNWSNKNVSNFGVCIIKFIWFNKFDPINLTVSVYYGDSTHFFQIHSNFSHIYFSNIKKYTHKPHTFYPILKIYTQHLFILKIIFKSNNAHKTHHTNPKQTFLLR